MLKWYKITGASEEGLRNVLKSLRSQRLMVRKQNDHLIACSSTNHQSWLSHVCQDFGASLAILEAAPKGIRVPRQEVYEAACGEEFYDPILYSHHCRKCPKCKVTRPPKPAKGKVKTAAKLEPGQEFNLNGVVASLEIVRERMWEKLELIDKLLDNLKTYRDTKDKLTELTGEADQRIEAVRFLLQTEKM